MMTIPPTHRASILFVLALAIAAASGAGCSSQTKGQKAVESFSKTRDTLADSQNQVDATLAMMNRVHAARGEAVNFAYKDYQQSVEQLEKDAEAAAYRAKSMKEESDEYLRSWQEEMKSVKDPAIKASLESRREAVRSNYALVRMYADDVRKAYEPFLQSNKELVQALSIDLSPAGMTSLSTAFDSVAASGQHLKEKIALMQIALNNIAAGQSPLGGDVK